MMGLCIPSASNDGSGVFGIPSLFSFVVLAHTMSIDDGEVDPHTAQRE